MGRTVLLLVRDRRHRVPFLHLPLPPQPVPPLSANLHFGRLPYAEFLLVLLAGLYGFRLRPDSYLYAAGRLVPGSAAGGLIGIIGGMTFLITVSALAAAGCVALIPSTRGRLIFMALGGFWLLFPGVDALGVFCVGLAQRLGRRWWFVSLPVHVVAGLTSVSLLWRSHRPAIWAALIASAVALVFTADSFLRGDGGVSAPEHLVYTTRYFLPALFLWVSA